MSNSHLENTIFDLFCRYLPQRKSHLRRLASVCSAVQLAESVQLSKLACRLPVTIQQGSRVAFLRRFLDAPFFTQRAIYQPLVSQALRYHRDPLWHLTIDRSNLIPYEKDLLMVSLAWRKRAIPLAWQISQFGATSAQSQIGLIQQVAPLVPTEKAVILHGDSEFGAVPFMQYLTVQQRWDFILGQSSSNHYHAGDWQWRPVRSLSITPRQPTYLANICWTKKHRYGPINLFAFHNLYKTGPKRPRKDVRYCLTSLPIAHTLRRVGKRRWGTEPLFRDFKSSGWHLDLSGLTDDDRIDTLMVSLAFNYLWASSLGRWLSKSGRRAEIDSKKNDITAIFVSVTIGLFTAMKRGCQSRPG